MVLLSQSVGPDGNEQENVSKLGPEARVDPVAAALLLSGAAGRLSDGECSGAPAAPAGQEIICCCWKPPDEADINYEPIISVLFVLLKTTSWGKSVGPLRRKLNAELEEDASWWMHCVNSVWSFIIFSCHWVIIWDFRSSVGQNKRLEDVTFSQYSTGFYSRRLLISAEAFWVIKRWNTRSHFKFPKVS